MKKAGFSLIEVILASVIMAASLVPLILIYRQSLHQTEASLDEIQAMIFARETIDSISTIKASLGLDRMKDLGAYGENQDFVDISTLSRAYLFDAMDDSDLHSLSKPWLTPLPHGFRRLIKIYPTNLKSGKTYKPMVDSKTVLVRIEWQSVGSTKFNRFLELRAIYARDEVY